MEKLQVEKRLTSENSLENDVSLIRIYVNQMENIGSSESYVPFSLEMSP